MDADLLKRAAVDVRQMQAAMDRYLAGWRGWFDRHVEQDASTDRDD
ncbi:MAG TPA: hypothetical protein VGK11_09665 [Actinomycetota bacterium]